MHHTLSSNNLIYKFSRNNYPAIKVSSGDTVEIETQDCFANQLQKPEDRLDCIDWERVNPATGPVYVEGAQTGDTLKVTIEKIALNNRGVMAAGKSLGVLGDLLEGLESKLMPVTDSTAVFNDKLSIPLNPMIGVIGVSPLQEDINCGTPGPHGGNMDNKMIAKGSVLYLPIFADGALFALGDLHAAMGDGEIGVTGIEIAGRVTVKLEVLKNLKLSNPILQSNEHMATIASAKTLDEAVNNSTMDMFKLLSEKLLLDKSELVMLMSAVGQAQICQVVDPLKTARFLMPKWVLEKYDFKI